MHSVAKLKDFLNPDFGLQDLRQVSLATVRQKSATAIFGPHHSSSSAAVSSWQPPLMKPFRSASMSQFDLKASCLSTFYLFWLASFFPFYLGRPF